MDDAFCSRATVPFAVARDTPVPSSARDDSRRFVVTNARHRLALSRVTFDRVDARLE
jgi:hypothetical protein